LIATTALGDIEAQTKTALAGFHYHLTKPIATSTPIEALVRLGQVLDRPTELSSDEW
jgi:hypothetical protein